MIVVGDCPVEVAAEATMEIAIARELASAIKYIKEQKK